MAIARFAAKMQEVKYGQAPALNVPNYVTPFALAGIARTALIANNEHRDRPVSTDDVIEMCRFYANVKEPSASPTSSLDQIRGLLNRITYEQFGFQYSLMENVGRTLPLLLDHAKGCAQAPTEDQWADVLGLGLEDFVRMGLVLNVAAIKNRGVVSRDLLRAPHVAKIFTPLSAEQGIGLIDRNFAATVSEQRTMALAQESPGFEKWSFNPLVARPIVSLEEKLITPLPRFTLERVTPTGLYFDGFNAWKRSFTDALGCMFEAYVGSQLRLLQSAVVHSEVAFGKPEVKTVDWFIVTEDCVVLVEAKASRPIWGTRLGDIAGDEDFGAKIGTAVNQIERTAKWIREGRHELVHIPRDRPLFGLVVTLEPFHLADTVIYRDLFGTPSLPIAVVTAHELEGFIAATWDRSDLGPRFVSAFSQAGVEPPSLIKAVQDLPRRPNPILKDSWKRFTAVIDELSDA